MERRLIDGLVFLTGFSALVYEVVWQRTLANLLGSEARATTLVLATFLGGLAIGYRVFGRVSSTRSAVPLVKAAGWMEFLIGAWAMAFPAIFTGVSTVFGATDPERALAPLHDVWVSAMLVGPPTVLMGATLPLLTQALSRSLDDATGVHARIYAVNTAGAFAGCLSAGFGLLPTLGLSLTLQAVGPLNLAAGLLMIALAPRFGAATGPASSDTPVTSGATQRTDARLSSMAFIAGFCSIGLQSLLVRLVGIAAGSSEYAFSIVVSMYILLLAWGAHRVRTLDARAVAPLTRNQLGVLVGMALLLWLIPQWPWAVHVLRMTLSTEWPAFYLFHALLFVLLLLACGLAVASMGRTMPLLFHLARDRTDRLGARVGELYFWNTVGCVLGALVGGYGLLGLLGSLQRNLEVLALALGATVALAATLEVARGSRWRLVALGVPVLALTTLALPRWPELRLAAGTFRIPKPLASSFSGPDAFYEEFSFGKRVVYRRDDPMTSVAVIQYADKPNEDLEVRGGSRTLFVNGKSDGNSTGDLETMILATHLPLAFVSTPSERVGLIGFGTGVSAGSAALHERVKQVEALEISPAVRDAAPMFAAANLDVANNPKLRWRMADAYRVLTTEQGTYAMLMSEPSNPWVTGVERLFAEEFYQQVRGKLQPGGVYAQWLGAYNLSNETFGSVVRTFASVFRQVRVFEAQPGDMLLLGADALDEATFATSFAAMLQRPALRADLGRIHVSSVWQAVMKERAVHPGAFHELAPHSLDRPKLSYAAGRDFFEHHALDGAAFTAPVPTSTWHFKRETELLGFKLLALANAPPLSEVAPVWCGRPTLGSFRGWRQSTVLCRKSLASLLATGALNDGGLDEPTLALLKSLAATGPVVAARDVSGARAAVSLFLEFDSAVLRLEPQRLLDAAQPCLAGTTPEQAECRLELLRALLLRGRLQAAHAALEPVTAGLPAEVASRFSEVLQPFFSEATACWGDTSAAPTGSRP